MSDELPKEGRRVNWSCPCGETGTYWIPPGESDSLAAFKANVQHVEQTIESACCEDIFWEIIDDLP